jgi:hypothetical protein
MTIVSSGQTQNVSFGQTVSGTIVLCRRRRVHLPGGTADGTVLSGVMDDYGTNR